MSEDRGKRRLAKQLLLYNGIMLTAGILVPEALDIGKFIAPFVFPAAIGLFIGDAYFESKRITNPLSGM